MPESPDEIVLPITLSTEEADRALADFRQRAAASGREVARGFDDGARSAGGGTHSLIGALQEYRREQVQSSRAARFFAAELMSIVPGAGVASGAMRDLVNVLIEGVAGGGAFAVGFEAVKLGIGLVTEHLQQASEAERKFADEMRRAREEQQRQLSEAVEATRVAALVHLGYADAQAVQIRKMQEADKAAKTASDSLKVLAEEIAHLRANPYIGSENRIAQLQQEKTKYEQTAAAAAAFRTQLEILRAQQAESDRRAQSALATKAIYETGQADREARNEAQLARLEMAKRFADERQVIELEGNAKITKLVQDAAANQNVIARRSLEEQAEFERGKLADRLDMYDAYLAAREARIKLDSRPDREAPAQELTARADAAGSTAGEKKEVQDKINALRALGVSSLETMRQKYDEEIKTIDRAASLQLAGATTFEETERLKTEATERYSQQRIEAWKRETIAGQMAATAQARIADMVGSQFMKMATHSRAYEKAMRASGKAEAETASEREGAMLSWLQTTLGTMAQQAAVQSVMELGLGFAALAAGTWPPNPAAWKAAGEHFTASAIFAGVGGLTAAAGYGIGEVRPMTREERQQADGVSSFGGGGREAGGTGATGGSTVVRDTLVVYVADPFETPQEAARRAVNRLALAQRLNMYGGQTQDHLSGQG